MGSREGRCVAMAVEGVLVGAGVFNDPGQARGYVTLVGVVGGVSRRGYLCSSFYLLMRSLRIGGRTSGPLGRRHTGGRRRVALRAAAASRDVCGVKVGGGGGGRVGIAWRCSAGGD